MNRVYPPNGKRECKRRGCQILRASIIDDTGTPGRKLIWRYAGATLRPENRGVGA